ncbi:hypothetical protein [Streptomyces sp. TR1341]|uniref:hypothetical protein n=1 Tax=Streptomyces sp. TR1341 TaxID=2601266 RepID=UPI001EE3B4D7
MTATSENNVKVGQRSVVRTRGASGDIIRVEADDDGCRWAGETVTVLETSHRLGTTGEGIERFRMAALRVVTTAWRAAAIT